MSKVEGSQRSLIKEVEHLRAMMERCLRFLNDLRKTAVPLRLWEEYRFLQKELNDYLYVEETK